MKSDKSYVIRRVDTAEEMLEVFGHFRTYLPEVFDFPENTLAHAEKIAAYGACFAAYFEDSVLGFTTLYANDDEGKCSQARLLAVSDQAGLLRGLIWKELFIASLRYAKDQGMLYSRGEVMDDNGYARKQYESIGMRVIGRASGHSSYVMGEIDTMLSNLNR